MITNDFKCDLIICTETRTTADILDSEISIQGYETIRSDSPSRHSGGVVVYKRAGVKVNVVQNFVNGYDNVLVFDVENSPCRGEWIAVYHSPNSPHAAFIDHFVNIVEENYVNGKLCYICGDFNVNMHDNNPIQTNKLRLTRFAHDYSLKQCVKKSTRVTQVSSTIIDLFFTNDNLAKIEVDEDILVADHKAILMRKKSTKKNYERIRIDDRSAYSPEAFSELLISCLSNTVEENFELQQATRSLYESMEASANMLISNKFVIPSYSKRWFTTELSQLRNKEKIAHQRAQLLNDTESWESYRKIRNSYNKKLRNAKNDEIKNVIVQNKGDMSRLWKELKKIFNNSSVVPDYVKFDDQLLGNYEDIANRFNEFFINSIIDIHGSIQPLQLQLPRNERINSWNKFTLVNKKQVCDIIDNIKKKTGVNNVNKDVLRTAFNVCGDFVLKIYNSSLSEGIFPDVLKFTIVHPIPKVKGTNKADEFRPVNSASPLDKVLQTAVKIQLENHLSVNKILSDVQSGFRGKHSCETSINLILLSWKEAIMNKKKIIAVFLDLRRAFETVDRNILIEILHLYGLSGTVLEWFRSWLTNRRQYTKFRDNCSIEIANDLGIPQGTPLSCILFILYINELPNCLIHCRINLFADDTLIWIESDDVQGAVNMMNEDLERVGKFLQMLKLKLNTSKTKYMALGFNCNEYDLKIQIDSCDIDKVNVMKYLGVMIDKNLLFNENIDYLNKKIGKKVAFLGRVKKKMDQDTRLLFYKTIISPHFDYCSTVLMMANETQIDRLQKQQNRALRIILNEDRRTNIHSMLTTLSLLDVKQRICFNVLVMMYKGCNGLLPDYLCRHFSLVGDTQPYNLRNNNLIRPPSYRTNAAQNQLIYKGSLMYNELLKQYPVCDNLKNFKKIAEEFVKTKYSSHRVPEP